MGALDLWRSISRTADVQTRPDGVTGLWWQQPQNNLTQIVIDDIYGDIPELIDRSTAMKVPAVSRARDLLVGSIADLPLIAYNNQTPVTRQPTWAYRSDFMSPWHRMA